MKRTIVALIISIYIINIISVNSVAEPKTMSDGGLFDAEYYASNNPDVVNALGNDPDQLYLHYKTFGVNEGRQPYAPDFKPSVNVKDSDEKVSLPEGIIIAPPKSKGFAGKYKDYTNTYMVELSAGKNNSLILKTGKGGIFTYAYTDGANGNRYNYINEDATILMKIYGNVLSMQMMDGSGIPLFYVKF